MASSAKTTGVCTQTSKASWGRDTTFDFTPAARDPPSQCVSARYCRQGHSAPDRQLGGVQCLHRLAPETNPMGTTHQQTVNVHDVLVL